MATNNPKEIDFSLSDEEKNDLDRMIQDFNRERSALSGPVNGAKVDQQLKAMQDRFQQISDLILKINGRVDSLYEILRLMHQKSEILDARIKALRDAQ